jgi:hypothetical protein
MSRSLVIGLIALVAATGCSSAAGSSPEPSGPAVPYACLGLAEPDCTRAFEAAKSDLAPADDIVYAEVGPFGCPTGEGCPNTLAGRPSGQVVFERSNGEPVAISATAAADGTIATAPGEWFGVAVAPSSTAGQLGGEPIPYGLGHCGLGSGVDVDGSWWDPVGFVNIDHGDSINAAAGTFAPSDPNHATFTSDAGFAVSLVRRVGEKHLPMCM